MTRDFTRRTCLGMAAAAVGTRLVVAEQTHTQPAMKPKIDAKGFAGTVRDRLWISVALGDDTTMTPAESALYLGVPNVILTGSEHKQPLDHQLALSLSGFTRVIWPTGDATHLNDVVRPLLADFPNIKGVFLDYEGSHDLTKIKEVLGRLELWLNASPDTVNSLEGLQFISTVVLWAMMGDITEPSLARLEKVLPAADIMIGFPFQENHEEAQYELALKWLRNQRIAGLVFMAGNGITGDAKSANHLRKWIAELGGEKL